MTNTKTIYNVGGEKQDYRTVYKREISVVEIRQTAEDCFTVRITQHAPDWIDDGCEVEVIVNADQLFCYREFQKQTFRAHGIAVYVPDVEDCDGDGWIYYILSRLTYCIGGAK